MSKKNHKNNIHVTNINRTTLNTYKLNFKYLYTHHKSVKRLENNIKKKDYFFTLFLHKRGIERKKN